MGASGLSGFVHARPAAGVRFVSVFLVRPAVTTAFVRDHPGCMLWSVVGAGAANM